MDRDNYQDILDNLFDAVYYVDINKRITYWNKAAERVTGFFKDEVIGSRCSDDILRHIDYDCRELCIEGCPLGKTLLDGEVRTIDAFLHHKEGHRVPVSIRVSPVKDDSGKITGAVEIFSDNSSRDSILEELEKLRNEAYTDSLTGAGNRRYLETVLDTRMKEYKEHKVNFGVIFLDIDNFKNINDTHGHDTGDDVIKMVSRTVGNILRKLDVLCRWGGEEFVAVVPNINSKYLEEMADRIRIFIEKSFFMKGDMKISVTASIGAAIINEDDTIESLLKRGDELMYKSKKTGKNRVCCDI